MTKTIIVTGGSGKAGRACIKDLIAHGYDVINVDRTAPQEPICSTVIADLTDFGETIDSLSPVNVGSGRVDGIVHMAAIPAPRIITNAATFHNNIQSTYNVFEAARQLGIRNIVWASSETVLGLPFDTPPPYLPVDENYPGRPESAYSLTKLLGENMAEQFCRWDPDMKIIGLRFSNVMDPHDYARFEGFDVDSRIRKWNLWGYIDSRDAAQAVRKALESTIKGAEVFVIANADTVMARPNHEIVAEVFPTLSVPEELGENDTLLSIEKARRVLGYEPMHSWRNTASRES